jgi:hypothetical protein
MKKARNPTPAKKASQKEPVANPSKKAEGGNALAEAVVQLTKTTDTLAQAAEKLSQAAVRLQSAERIAQPQHEAGGPTDELPEDKGPSDDVQHESD